MAALYEINRLNIKCQVRLNKNEILTKFLFFEFEFINQTEKSFRLQNQNDNKYD